MIDASAIPHELRDEVAWLCWRLEQREKGETKVPYSALTHRLASSTNPATWATFDQANLERVRHKPPYSGIGRAITAPRVGIDLDYCRNPETGVIAAWGLRIIRLLDSYTEISPSGTGVHIWVTGDWSAGWNNRRGPKVNATKSMGVEVYRQGKYFTFTGERLEGTPATVNERSAQLAQLAVSEITFDVQVTTPHPKAASTSTVQPASTLDDDALIKTMFASALGAKIERLWKGDSADFGGDDSRADWDFIDHLLYWTDYDSIRTDRLFRLSDRMRAKWDEPHFSNKEPYGAGSIRRRMEKKLKTRGIEQMLPAAGPTEIINAADLQRMVFPPAEHIIPGLITKGLSVLAGKSKHGKSWMILDASIAVAEGGIAAGRFQCEQGSVLYLALEDGFDRLQKRMKVLVGDRPWPPKLHLAVTWPTMDDPLCLQRIETWLKSTPDAKMVVIDIFQRFRPMPSRGLNMYQQDYKDAAPLQSFARDFGVAIVLLHHVNKLKLTESDDVFDAISGSTGLPGAADTPMVLRKLNKTNATLYLRGRDIEEQEYALTWNMAGASWLIVGDAESIALSLERREVLGLFKERSSLTPKYVSDELGLDSGTARQRLFTMKRDGLLIRTMENTYIPSPNAPNADNDANAPNALTVPSGEEAPNALTPKITPKITLLPGENGQNVRGVSGGDSPPTLSANAVSSDELQRDGENDTQNGYVWPRRGVRAAHPEQFCQTCPRQLVKDNELVGGYCQTCMDDLAEKM